MTIAGIFIDLCHAACGVCSLVDSAHPERMRQVVSVFDHVRSAVERGPLKGADWRRDTISLPSEATSMMPLAPARPWFLCRNVSR